MKLPPKTIKALCARLRGQANAATARSPDKLHLSKSPLHMKGLMECSRALRLVEEWEGPLDELEAKLKPMEDSFVSALMAADALLSNIPVGLGVALGHTSGMPEIEDQKTGSTRCHRCGEPMPVFFPAFESVFLKMHVGHDVLLFVMHPKCLEDRAAALIKGGDAEVLVPVDREEWMLLLAAKDVLSS
jgi:hypothetical protein